MKKAPTRSRAKAVASSQHLHVVQPKHTGHVLHRRHTSYPLLAMIVLCAGVFIASWTRYVAADFPGPVTNSYTVNVSVPGPPPATPATIDQPTAGTVFTSTPITVSGSCPVGSYVSVMRNGFNSGVALCNASGQYQLSMDLFAGLNQLTAQDYSFTDVPGPAGATVDVTYDPPAALFNPAAGNRSTSPYNPVTNPGNLPEPLLLKTSFTFLGYYVNTDASWKVSIEGGSAPYAVNVEWGDGQHQLYSVPSATTLMLTHRYSHTGGYHGSYVVKIYASDSAGNQAYLQLIAIITSPPKTVSAISGPTGTGGLGNIFSASRLSQLARYIWPGYGVVVLMLMSFWLGERWEFVRLRPRLKRVSRRHA